MSSPNSVDIDHLSEGCERATLGQRFDEIREICARYDYELDTGERSDHGARNESGGHVRDPFEVR